MSDFGLVRIMGKDEEVKMHVPVPPHREGGTSFPSPHDIPAGHHSMLPIDCSGEETRDLAYGLLRVLNDECEAVGDWNPNLSADEMRSALEHMLRIRAYDDRMMMMQRGRGKRGGAAGLRRRRGERRMRIASLKSCRRCSRSPLMTTRMPHLRPS